MFLKNLFTRDPFAAMARSRAKADRLGVVYLERHAMKGTVNAELVRKVARTINRHPDDLVEMIPDRRRPGRHAKAMAGLRNAGLLQSGQLMREDEHEIE